MKPIIIESPGDGTGWGVSLDGPNPTADKFIACPSRDVAVMVREALIVSPAVSAVSLGRLGGLKGGKACAASLTPEQRKERASNAAKARWGKDK